MEWISYEAVRTWLALLQIAQMAIAAAVMVYARRISRDRARRQEIVALEEEIGTLRDRVHAIESELRHLPTYQDLGAISTRVNGVAEQTERLNGHFTALSRQVATVNEHLLNRAMRET